MWITGAESETCKLFSFRKNLFRINVSYDKESRNSFSNNANYDKESRHYYYCFGGCYSIGTESGAFRLFWSKLGDVSLLQLNLKHGNFFVKDSLNNNANLGKEPKCFFCSYLPSYK
uniref:Uncharacterized protein n=1 Tax=Strongyloides stercoralis TaxID=6248 RepID=A0AAF5DEB2_STRER